MCYEIQTIPSNDFDLRARHIILLKELSNGQHTYGGQTGAAY